MKSTIKLTISEDGSPIIEIRNHDKSEELGDKLMDVFCKSAKTKGIEIDSISGYADTEGKSWNNYIIKTK